MADERDDFPIEDEVITLTDEDGHDHDFIFLDVIQVDEKEYAVLVPAGSDQGDEEDEAVILRMDTDEQGESSLVTIDDDDEWQRVVDAWDQLEEEDVDEGDEAGDDEEESS